MNRFDLFDKLQSLSEPDHCCLINADGVIGWLHTLEQVKTAFDHWRNGTLNTACFQTKNDKGKTYAIKAPVRMGIVPHYIGKVGYFAPDLDAHAGQVDTTVLSEKLSRFFKAQPVQFHSKSGKGIRQIYLLEQPVEIQNFLETIKSWGFNRKDRIEVFPKTGKLTQFWLPNEPNTETGGDSYIGGTWEKAVIHELPPVIPARLNNRTLDYLLGFADKGTRHESLFVAAKDLGKKRVDRTLAEKLCIRAAQLCGQDLEKARKKFNEDFAAGQTESPVAAVQRGTPPDAGAIRSHLWEISQDKNIEPSKRYSAIADAVVRWLHGRGKFYHTETRDFNSVLFFDTTRKDLIPVRSDSFVSWLSDCLAMNRAERAFSFVQSAVEVEGLTARSTMFEPSRYWAARSNAIYLSNAPGRMVRITANGVAEIDNGSDGVLFPYGSTLAPWRLTDPRDPFETCRLFSDISTKANHGKALFKLWVMSLPSDQRTKPPLCISGGIGSGKTRLAKGVFELFGIPPRIAAVMKNGEGDFWASLDGGGLACFDNADTRVDWLPDALAAAATAGSCEKRRLYTNADRVLLKANSCVIITSSSPEFASDPGLADRLVVVRLNKRVGNTAEGELSDGIFAIRDAGLSWIAHTLALALSDHEPVPEGLNQRHPDFASLATRIGRAIGCGGQAIAALTAAENDKSLFNIENDNIGTLLLDVMKTEKFDGTTAELLEKLKTIDPMLDGRISNRKLGKRLAKLWPHLQKVFQATSETGSGRTETYHFAKNGEFGEFKTAFSEKSLCETKNNSLPKNVIKTHQTHQTDTPCDCGG